jgi:hypothetical protein
MCGLVVIPKCLEQGGGVGLSARFVHYFLHGVVAWRVKPWYHQVSTLGS